jgi:sterol desaturase/sphingolipid hydroxylase (fatty acid hydroxylase superfamily)
LSGLFYYFCYHFEFEFFERYKAFDEPWPWNKDRAAWNKLFFKTVINVAFNIMVILPMFSAFHWTLGLPIYTDCSPDRVPGPLKFILQILFCTICEDFSFHMAHRLLHRPFIYPSVHKIHHQHSISTFITAQYAHPLEYIFSNIIPTTVGPMILGKSMHISAVMAWFNFRTIESYEGHSGYEFSWSPYRLMPFTTDYGYHIFHHSHNVGNYSSFFMIWDYILGSNKLYFEYLSDFTKQNSKRTVKVEWRQHRNTSTDYSLF